VQTNGRPAVVGGTGESGLPTQIPDGPYLIEPVGVDGIYQDVEGIRLCCRQVSITVSRRSMKWLSLSLWVPMEICFQITAWRSDHSAALLVGCTPGQYTSSQRYPK